MGACEQEVLFTFHDADSRINLNVVRGSVDFGCFSLVNVKRHRWVGVMIPFGTAWRGGRELAGRHTLAYFPSDPFDAPVMSSPMSTAQPATTSPATPTTAPIATEVRVYRGCNDKNMNIRSAAFEMPVKRIQRLIFIGSSTVRFERIYAFMSIRLCCIKSDCRSSLPPRI